jgi:hypothetical protein
MKGARQKEGDAAAAVRHQLQVLHDLHAGLPRAIREYPAVAGIDWEPLEDGQVLVLRMLYPYEMVRVKLPEDKVAELCNRGLGLTAGGAQIATPEQAAAILGNGFSEALG